jgi:hypothetical protein
VSASPLHPYGYECQYGDGRRLRWDSPGGPWGEVRLPIPGLERLVILGHRRGPITLDVGGLMPPPIGVVLRERGALTLGRGAGHRSRFCFGVRLPDGQIHAVRIDDRADVMLYHGDIAGW